MHLPFDLYEQVKLVETYMKIKDKPRAIWATYIKQLSTMYREYAKFRKIGIDEHYRNFRGITLQIQYLDYCFTQGKHGMKNNIRWMKNILSLYREERTKFEELLAEANEHFGVMVTKGEDQSVSFTKTQSTSALDIYEMAKLVELCSRKYDTKELLELSRLMLDYISRKNLTDSENLRSVYHLNRSISRIVRLLNGYEEKAGTLPIEREIVRLFKNNRREFDNILKKANELFDINTEIGSHCLSLLNDFPGGIDLDSSLDTDRFCLKYEEKYGEISATGKDDILNTLRNVGELRGKKIYPPASEAKKEMISLLCAEIKKIFSEGYSCVYIESILEKYREVLSKHAIYSVGELKNILSLSLEEEYDINRDRIIMRGNAANIGKDALLYLKNCGKPETLSDIYRDIWYIPSRQILEGIRYRDDIINTAIKTYMAVDIFPVNAEDIDKIRVVLKNALQNTDNGQLTAEECRKIVEKNFPNIAIDTKNYNTKTFNTSLGYLLGDDPHFEGKYVSLSKDDIQSAKEMIVEFCEDRDRFYIDELEDFAKENNLRLASYYGAIREKTLRISKDEFCGFELVNFKTEAIDEKLEQFCPEEYAPLKTVRNFQLLPAIENIPWNYFLLESYVNNISKKFKLMHIEFLKATVAGVMVRREVSFSNYDALLIDALSKANWTTEEDALNFLANEGYLASNQYAKIGAICKKAQDIKKNKER